MADQLWKTPEVTVFVQEGGPERLVLLAQFASGDEQTVEITKDGVTVTGKNTSAIEQQPVAFEERRPVRRKSVIADSSE